ncbi:MAG: hypothetical protein J6P43_03800 [Succinivibrionaceae bacterium]|nr:hypothetical protein [Succinivibrionaceae bacterium]
MSIFDEYLACLVHDILNEMNEEKESQITPVADNADNDSQTTPVADNADNDSQITPVANSEDEYRNLINSDNKDLNEK